MSQLFVNCLTSWFLTWWKQRGCWGVETGWAHTHGRNLDTRLHMTDPGNPSAPSENSAAAMLGQSYCKNSAKKRKTVRNSEMDSWTFLTSLPIAIISIHFLWLWAPVVFRLGLFRCELSNNTWSWTVQVSPPQNLSNTSQTTQKHSHAQVVLCTYTTKLCNITRQSCFQGGCIAQNRVYLKWLLHSLSVTTPRGLLKNVLYMMVHYNTELFDGIVNVQVKTIHDSGCIVCLRKDYAFLRKNVELWQ